MSLAYPCKCAHLPTCEHVCVHAYFLDPNYEAIDNGKASGTLFLYLSKLNELNVEWLDVTQKISCCTEVYKLMHEIDSLPPG